MIRKLIASLTAACFLFSFVIAPAVQASVGTAAPAQGATNLTTPKEFLPSRLGMVTRLHDYGSTTVVINIQDLHCHAEVQRNITGILKTLVEGYELDRVFIEGAAGDLDTSWLAGVKNTALKKEISDSLLQQGRLTGSEYYSIMNDKPRLLKGIENERMHRANIVRLGRILEKSDDRERTVQQLKGDIDSLQARYFSSRNRRFSRLVELHRKGKIASPKYYATLQRYVENIQSRPQDYGAVLSGGMEGFPAINGFLRLQALGKRLNYRLAVRQMSPFIQELKSRLPWKDYNDLLQKTGNLSNFDAVCGSFAPFYRQFGYDRERRFSELAPLFSYVELKQRINPLELVGEERRLVETVRSALARDESEREVSFLVDFFGCFEDYLATRVSAEDYGYVTGRYGEFRKVLGKYVKTDRLALLGADIALLGDYCRVNDDRTRTFLRCMFPGDAAIAHREFPPENTITSPETLLGAAREIIVVVTGGFHTEGFEKLLGEKKISSVVITPSVHEDTQAADVMYQAIIKEQGREFASNTVPEEQAPGTQGQLVALNTMQYVVETAQKLHLRALGLALLGGGDTIDEAKAAQLGITVKRDDDNRVVTLSNGKISRRLALPETTLHKLRAASARAFKYTKASLFKTGEPMPLGYWLAKALFPYETERQQAWGRRTVPLQTAALAAFFLISPAAGICAVAGGLVVQQLLKRMAAKRSLEPLSPRKYLRSAFKDAFTYCIFVALPASVGIAYAFYPLFVGNTVGFALFSVLAVWSALYNLHRLNAPGWSAPSAVATYALLGFAVFPVMGAIGALAMPVIAWAQVATIVYTLAMSVILVARGGLKSLSLTHLRPALRRVIAGLLAVFLLFPTFAASSGFAASYPAHQVQTVQASSSLWQGVPSLFNPGYLVRVLTGDTGYYEEELNTYISQMDGLTLPLYRVLESDRSFGPLQRKIQNIMKAMPRDPALRAGIAENIQFSNDIQKRLFVNHGVLLIGGTTVERVYLENLLDILPVREVSETSLIFVEPMLADKTAIGKNYSFFGKSFVVMREGGVAVGGHEVGHTAGPTIPFMYLTAISGEEYDNYQNNHGMANTFEDWATIYEMWVEDSSALISGMDRSPLFARKVREVIKKFVITRDGTTYLRMYKWNTYSDIPFKGGIADVDLTALARQYIPRGIGIIGAEFETTNLYSALVLVKQQLQTASLEDYFKMMYMIYTASPYAATTISQELVGKDLPAIPSTLTFDFLEAHTRSWEDLALLGNLNPEQVSSLLFSDPARANRLMAGFPRTDGRFLRTVQGMSFLYTYLESAYTADRALALSLTAKFPSLMANIPLPVDIDEAGMKFAEWFLFTQKMDWSDPNSQASLKDEQFLKMTIDYAMQLSPSERGIFLDDIAHQYFPMAQNFGPLFSDIVRARASLNDALVSRDYTGAGKYFDQLLGFLEECNKVNEKENGDKGNIRSSSDSMLNPMLVLKTITDADLQAMVWGKAQTDPAGALHMLAARQTEGFSIGIDIQFLWENKTLAIAMFKADPSSAREMLANNRFVGKVIANGSPGDAEFIAALINAVGPEAAAASMEEHRSGLVIDMRSTSEGNRLGNAAVEAYKNYAPYLPDSMQKTYQWMLAQIGAPKGTMTANKAKAIRWASEGKSGLSIAVRIALRETLPRMFAPEKEFIAGHAEKDKAAARSIVRAGKWGGIVAGIVSVVAPAGLLWNLASSSPLSLLLFVTLSGIAGWTAGRLVVGGVQQIAIDAAAYNQLSQRAPPSRNTTLRRVLRAVPAFVFSPVKKIVSKVLLKSGESTSLGYWLAKALFPYETERQQAWGRWVLPFQTAALAVFFLMSPTAGICALAGGFVAQQLLKLVAAKRSLEPLSPRQYIGSTLKEMATYGLFMAVPAGIGISYAFLPFFVSNPLSFTVFSALFVFSAVFNLHRLHALKWSAPSLVAAFALAGFVVPPVMGSIGAVAMPIVAWTQVVAIVYTVAMSAILLVSRGGLKSLSPHMHKTGSRVIACLLVLLLMLPTQTASMSLFEPAPAQNVQTISSLWQGVPSLLNPDDIVRVLTRDPGYYEDALSAYIKQMDDLTILKFNALYSDGSFGPLQRKIQNTLNSLPRDPARRAEIAGHIRFSSDIQKRAFVHYGVLVAGANKIDLVNMEKILAILPPAHYAGTDTTLIYFSPLYDQEEYKGMYFNIIGKSFIVIMDEEGYNVGAHEVGHANGPTAAFCALSALSGKDPDNYERQYGMKNVLEDWATIYAAWVEDSANLAERMSQSANFEAKIREAVKKFIITRDGQTYLRVYGKWNLGYTDVPFDGDVEHADLAALAAQAVTPDTLEARVLAKVSTQDSDGAKALVEQELKNASPQQLYDLIYAVFSVSGNDAVKISQLIAEKGLVALPGQMTFDYVEANVHSWEDLVLLGNMNPPLMSAVLLSDKDRLYRLIDSFPLADGRFLVYMDDADDMPFMPRFFESVYQMDQSLARSMLTRFPELITNVAIPHDMAAMAEDFLFNQVIDWTNPHTLDDKNTVRLEIMVLDYALRLPSPSRTVFLDHVERLYHEKNDDYGKALGEIASRLTSLNDALIDHDYGRAGTYYDELLQSLDGGVINRWLVISFLKDPDLYSMIWFRAQTDPAGALHMISERQRVLLGDLINLDFLSENKTLALAMLNSDQIAAQHIVTDNPFLGKLIARGSSDDADFIVSLIKSVGPGTSAASMNAYYWSQTSGGKDSESTQATAIIASFKDYAKYIPASEQALYQSVIDRVGGEKPKIRAGTMLANKAKAMQWVSEGRGGLYIAARIALMETLPRMLAPEKKFIAGHAGEDRAAARTIVRAGRWGGIIAGIGSVLASAGLLWNLASSSPVSWLLFVTLSGIAGWTAGRLVVGGVQQIAIDAAAYTPLSQRAPPVNTNLWQHILRVPAYMGTYAKKIVSKVLFRTGESTSLGYWVAKALFPYDTERQQAWGRRVIPLQTAALGAFFLMSPTAGICALAGGFVVQQLLKGAAVKRSFEPVSRRQYAVSTIRDLMIYGLFVTIPAALGISYTFIPLFISNSISFVFFSLFVAISAVYNLHRLHALKWSSPALVATFALIGFVVPPVIGAIGAVAMPVIAWTQVAAIVYTAAMSAILLVSRGGLKIPSLSHARLALSRLFICLLIVFFMFPTQALSSDIFGPAHPAGRVQTVQAAPSLWQGVPSLIDPVDIVRVLNGDPGYYEDTLSTYIEQMERVKLTQYSELSADGSFGPLQRKIQNIMDSIPRDPVQRAGMAAHIRFNNDVQKQIFIDHGILLTGANMTERVFLENLFDILPAREVGETSLVYVAPMSSENKAVGMNYHLTGKVCVVLRKAEVGGHEIGHTAGPTGEFWRLNAASGDDTVNYESAYGMTNAFEDWATIYAAWVEDSGRVVSRTKRSAIFEEKVREVIKKFVTTRDGTTYLRVYKWNTYTDVPFEGKITEADLAALASQYVPSGVGLIGAQADVLDFYRALILAKQQLETASPEDYYKMMYLIYTISSYAVTSIDRELAGKNLPAFPATLTFDFLEAHVHAWEDLALLGNLNPGQVSSLIFSDPARTNRLMAGFPRADGEFMRSMEGLSFMYRYFESVYAADPARARSLAAQYPELAANIPIPRDIDEAGMKFAEWFLFTQEMDWNDPYSQESQKDEQFLKMTIDYAMQLPLSGRGVFLDNIAGQHFPMAKNFGPMFSGIVAARALLNDALAVHDYTGAGRYFDRLLSTLEDCQNSGDLEQEKNKDKDGVTVSANRTFNPRLVLATISDADLQAMVWGRAQTDPAGALRMLTEKQRVQHYMGLDLGFLLQNKPLAIAMFRADPAAAQQMLMKNRFAGQVIADGTADAGFVADLINTVGPEAVAASMEQNRLHFLFKSTQLEQGCMDAYTNYAHYLPELMQDTYQSILDKIDADGRSTGTMLTNKPKAMRWASEGRSGLYIAVRIAFMETLPRMFAPEKKFIAGHAEKDKAAARSIVRAGKWGGIITGIGSVLASVGLLWNLASSSPVSWLLFVTLSGIAGWTAGRLVVGGLRQISIDAAVYKHMGLRQGYPLKADGPVVPVAEGNEGTMYGAYAKILSAS